MARTIDSDRKHLQSVLRAAAEHEGSAFVEIYQNCNIFNDGAFELLKDPDTRDDYLIRLEHGQPITFGADGAVLRGAPAGRLRPARCATPPRSRPSEIVVHDATVAEPAYAFALSRLPGLDLRNTPIGVFRQVGPAVVRPARAGVSWQTAKAKANGGTPERDAGRPAQHRRHLDHHLDRPTTHRDHRRFR